MYIPVDKNNINFPVSWDIYAPPWRRHLEKRKIWTMRKLGSNLSSYPEKYRRIPREAYKTRIRYKEKSVGFTIYSYMLAGYSPTQPWIGKVHYLIFLSYLGLYLNQYFLLLFLPSGTGFNIYITSSYIFISLSIYPTPRRSLPSLSLTPIFSLSTQAQLISKPVYAALSTLYNKIRIVHVSPYSATGVAENLSGTTKSKNSLFSFFHTFRIYFLHLTFYPLLHLSNVPPPYCSFFNTLCAFRVMFV